VIGYDSFAGLSAPHPVYDSGFYEEDSTRPLKRPSPARLSSPKEVESS